MRRFRALQGRSQQGLRGWYLRRHPGDADVLHQRARRPRGAAVPRVQESHRRGIEAMRRVAGSVLIWIVALVATSARQQTNQAVAVDSDDIGGVVTTAKGPEAGVWVIADTTDLPTKFAKIV